MQRQRLGQRRLARVRVTDHRERPAARRLRAHLAAHRGPPCSTIVPPSRSTYTDDDVARLLVIKRMKPLDFTLEEMRDLLTVLDELRSAGPDDVTRADLAKRLAVYRALVEERRAKIRARLADAEQFAAELSAELRGHRP
ncbi:MerR family transcriptional regulator [Spirillospora sp. NPDC052242]